MILYHAGGEAAYLYYAFLGPGDHVRAVPILTETTADSALVSYAYVAESKRGEEYFALLRDSGAKRIMLDSGAFSVHNSGGEIDIAQFERDIERLAPDVYVQLDVIGDAKGTRKNLERMRADGFKPLPVFTRGAPWSDLERLLDEGEDYICLGNIAKADTKVRLDWCSYVFGLSWRWMQKNGRTQPPRYHAFGCTEPEILFAFPFYSADSSGALMQAVFGRVQKYFPLERRLRSVNVNEEANAWRCPDGLDLGVVENRTRPQMRRAVANAHEMEKMSAHVTKSWTARGVTFDD